MTIRQLEANDWEPYFDRVSKALVGRRAFVEVAALSLGDQVAAEWVPIIGITYDPKDDILELALEGLDHLIHKPRQVFVDEGPMGLASAEAIDEANRRHIIRLKEPLMLPARSGAGQSG